MDRKRERLIWISTTAVLLTLLAVILLSPVASAQTNRTSQEYMRDLETAMYIIQSNYVDEVDPDTLFKGAMDGMFSNLNDPYSLYLDDEFLEQMTDTTKGKYGGVGLYISKDHFDPDNPYGRLPYVKVVSPIEDTPSWRAGINAGDYIYAIEEESAEGFSTQDVSNRLRGTPGSDVKVTILRDGGITFDVVLTRAEIEIPTVNTPFTEPRVEESLRAFNSQGLDKLIIDVRSNPGGLLDSVVDIADLFFSGGVIVSTRYRQERQNQVHRAAPGKIVPSDMKIVIFGKGSIQQMIPLDDAAIKLTTGRYYTPDGYNIDKTGIDPDIPVEEPELTEDQLQSYATMLQENRVGAFIDENPHPSVSDVDAFIRELQSDGLDPGERIIRLMVKRESERRLNSPPVVDMEFDSVLIRAVDFLDTGK